MGRLIEEKIKSFFVDEVLFGRLSRGGRALVDYEDSGYAITVTEEAPEPVRLAKTETSETSADNAAPTEEAAPSQGEPPVGTGKESIIKLARMGWTVDEISRAMKYSKYEVERILKIAPKEP